MTRIVKASLASVVAVLLVVLGVAQLRGQVSYQTVSPVNIATMYALVPISSTAAVNAQTTLTIPAPPPTFYNYVCSIHLNISQDTTGTVITNAVTTSTNFNLWALKFSTPLTANGNYDFAEGWGIANVGCAKSTSPGIPTTFVSPAAVLHSAFTWDSTYYQAP